MTPNQSTLIHLHQERAANLVAAMAMTRVGAFPLKPECVREGAPSFPVGQEYLKSIFSETTK